MAAWKLISADSHIVEPPDMYTDRIEPRSRVRPGLKPARLEPPLRPRPARRSGPPTWPGRAPSLRRRLQRNRLGGEYEPWLANVAARHLWHRRGAVAEVAQNRGPPAAS